VWETPSPVSSTIPVVRPDAYSDRTAWIATYIVGELNVPDPNMIEIEAMGKCWPLTCITNHNTMLNMRKLKIKKTNNVH